MMLLCSIFRESAGSSSGAGPPLLEYHQLCIQLCRSPANQSLPEESGWAIIPLKAKHERDCRLSVRVLLIAGFEASAFLCQQTPKDCKSLGGTITMSFLQHGKKSASIHLLVILLAFIFSGPSNMFWLHRSRTLRLSTSLL